MKVALIYDRVNKWGGAERIVLALKELFPQAPLYTSVYNPKTASWANTFVVKPSFLQQIPLSHNHEWFAPLMPLAFESFSFDAYDLVISVTSEAAKGIITKPQTKHLCICLTPTRYLWSGYDEYFKNTYVKFLTKPLIWYLQTWDKVASNRPDLFIAISEEVKKRIETYYKKDAVVIYPPSILGVNEQKKEQKGSYFLVVSRLSKFTKYKRVDIAVAAATKLSLPLKVVGDGDSTYLQKYAGPTVEFVGKVSDGELISYYKNCKALIFPGLEDFGLVMVEAQSFGKPIIAFKGGGALEIVKAGKTGEFFPFQTTESLVSLLAKFKENHYNSEDCRKNAQRFGFEEFKKSLSKAIETLV